MDHVMDFALPVSIQTMVIEQQGTIIYYPQVFGLPNNNVQQSINERLFQTVQLLAEEQAVKQNTNQFMTMVGNFEIKTNERNILSLTLTNYAYAYQHANGLTIMKSLTFNVQTGKLYELKDLFNPGSPYIDVLSNHIKQQIEERDIPVFEPFTTISPHQDFYIADKSLIIYFQPIELTPHYYGFPMFPISVYDIQDIINEDGPLGIMATND